jgi:hypothetical protein
MLTHDWFVRAIQNGRNVLVEYRGGTQPIEYDAEKDQLKFSGKTITWIGSEGHFERLDRAENDLTQHIFKPTEESLEDVYWNETAHAIDVEKKQMRAATKHLLDFYSTKPAIANFGTVLKVYELKDIRCRERGKGVVLVAPLSIGKDNGQRISGYMYDSQTHTLSYETVAAWRFTNSMPNWLSANCFDKLILETQTRITTNSK